jgi:hypothetical protein
MVPHILKHDHGVTLVVAWVWPDGRLRLAQYELVESVELTPGEFEQVTSLRGEAMARGPGEPFSPLPLTHDSGIMPARKKE